MNVKKTMFALAVGSVGIMGAMSAHAFALVNGNKLTINAGVPVFDAYGDPINVTGGSWFAVDGDGNSAISGIEKSALSMGTTGIIIGQPTTAGASHFGEPVAGDTNAITAPWNFFGSTGSDFTTTGITGSTTAGLDFSGWTVTWRGIVINLGGGAWGTGFTNSMANFIWDGVYGSSYTLDYRAAIPLGDPSGFGGIQYALHLSGNVIPEPGTYFMVLAGLGLIGTMGRRKKPSQV